MHGLFKKREKEGKGGQLAFKDFLEKSIAGEAFANLSSIVVTPETLNQHFEMLSKEESVKEEEMYTIDVRTGCKVKRKAARKQML